MASNTEYAGGHQPLDVLIHASLLAERAPEREGTGRGLSPAGNAYRCPMKGCEKTFTKKWNLKVHVRLHTGDEPFKCKYENCNKSFRWRSSLKSHERTHENTAGRRKTAEMNPPPPSSAGPKPQTPSMTKLPAPPLPKLQASPLGKMPGNSLSKLLSPSPPKSQNSLSLPKPQNLLSLPKPQNPALSKQSSGKNESLVLL